MDAIRQWQVPILDGTIIIRIGRTFSEENVSMFEHKIYLSIE